MLSKVKSKFSALSRGGKIGVVAAALVIVSSVASAANNNQSSVTLQATKTLAPLEQPTSQPLATPQPEVKTITETQDVSFEKTTVDDSSMAVGTTKLRTAGVVGKKTLTYEITVTGGVESDKKLVNEVVTAAPTTEVTARGTKVATVPAPKPSDSCNSNYTGCVPIASDVDCAGGSGNGPAYVSGPIRVIGIDVYDLDRDGNGIACE